MKVLQINSLCGVRSTGRIASDLSNVLESKGHECLVAYGREPVSGDVAKIRIGTNFDVYCHAIKSRITDKQGFYSTKATKTFIKNIIDYNPDIIHLHGIHGYYLNIEVLFNYLKKTNKPVVWTLHDCWAFTGHCGFFDYANCNKWKTGCYNCPEKTSYPVSYIFDNSKNNYNRKKEIFTSLENVILVTPSQWLRGLVEKSYLNNYPIRVVNNGIDLEIFRPTNSNFRKKYNLENKMVILGVASTWERRKGLKYFIHLSNMLDEKYKIVLIGVSKKQKKSLPPNILAFTRTNNAKELAQIYTAADIFANPTLEDNFPTVNLESLACGTPVITFNTGGSPESINEKCGIVVEKGNINKFYESIINYKGHNFSQDICVEHAKSYNKIDRFNEYIDIYDSLVSEYGI